MWLRRIGFAWQFIAAVVLPLWLFIARGVVGAEIGWDVVAFFIAAPVLFVAMIVVAGLTALRPSNRAVRAVDWIDLGIMAAWHATIIGFCITGSGWAGLIGVMIGVAAFWIAIWRLVTDTGRRMRAAAQEFADRADAARRGGPIEIGEMVVIEESVEGTVRAPRPDVAE